jgi:hypothetical protein
MLKPPPVRVWRLALSGEKAALLSLTRLCQSENLVENLVTSFPVGTTPKYRFVLILLLLFPLSVNARVYLTSDSPRAMALRNQPMGRSFDENTSGKINPAPRVPKPRILTKAEWGGGEGTTTLMRSHFPTSITLHHTGDAKPLTHDVDPAKLLRAIQQWGWRDKHWPDLPYHYLIDLDGNIYQGRDPLKVGDTSTTYDPTGHLLVSVIGNYMLQAPNEKQLESIIDLFAYLCDLYNINPETLRGHQ